MTTDGVITLRPMAESELAPAHDMSARADNREFIIPGSLEKHRSDYARPDIVYLSIAGVEPGAEGADLLGYLILVLEEDGRSVECRRIVVDQKNRGIGRRAMQLLDEYCKHVLRRDRIWLDVYDFNTRGQRVYESTGYRYQSQADRDGKTLFFYEKDL